jgi:hypothetical protein
MNADGSSLTRLTHDPGIDTHPNDFDVDAFVISDELSGGGQEWFKIGPEPLRNIGRNIDKELRQYPEFKGMRTGKGKFRFRIFSEMEIMRKAKKGDAQFYFIEANKIK